ncbi:TyeA family type III secretion system gatekeeper subunit [Prosthecobacter vanneervenii]|uniref:Type III secretion system TyeA family effector delivery regulator n=1 Tax=Prosthecobacter vanneervenii TaxID=48466 RepID=A0A7W7Y7X5_9BACT|nr:TyeA family type III secretion system gatekeeper subunit [Prosthecobacter vanneervenii]MBB5031239.1 type III secretion system TyeA family effector delivery regulator [Prosthecobacter vanneervenii]
MADVYTAHDLMRELLEMTTQRWVDPDRFIQITNKIGVKNSEMRIYFLTQLREKVRQIPLKLYPSPDIREKLLDALQQAMDTEISREEAVA